MKKTFTILLSLIFGLTANSQSDSIPERQFQLTGKIKEKVLMTPHCGTIAWGTVVAFQVIDLVGMSYPSKHIGIIITCPELYADNFFVKGKTYQVVFNNTNQSGFGYTILNSKLLLKNSVSFVPYAVSIKKIP